MVQPLRKELDMPFDEAIDHVKQCLQEAGFGFVSELSIHNLLQEKIGVERPEKYHVLGACQPKLANQALDVSLNIGSLFPCNTVLWQEPGQKVVVYHVSIMSSALELGIVPDNEAWKQVMDQASAATHKAFELMGQQR